MNRIYYTTSSPLTKVLVLILAAVLLFASYTVATEIDRAHAEEITTQGYILCKSYVVIRQWASKRATEIGQLDPAEPIEIDGKTKDGYAHIVAPCDGWVWAGYITFSEPQKIDAPGVVTAKKR
ncbi:MAG: SH3 domain-containing protein, partial [Acidaminococcaceae bacterium]|nr:SH3 domain-containing protein [Acidaminococcaceae bacterium]